jgi:hypothetical protein
VTPGLALQVVRAGYGAALLLAPGPVIQLCTGRPPGTRARNVARVLGARHVLQAAVTAAAAPGAEALGIGAAIDLTHAASMAGLAVLDRRVRRVTLTDAVIETGFAAASLSSALPSRTS